MNSPHDELVKRATRAAPTEPPVAPAGSPPPPAPGADPSTPQIDPAIQAALDEERRRREEAEKKQAEIQRQSEELQARLAALEAQSKQVMQLPTAEELDGMRQGEATLKVAEAMKAHVDAALRSFASDLNRNVVAPAREQYAKLTLEQKMGQAREIYGANPVNKHRAEFEATAAKYPELTGAQILRLLASDGELSPAGAPTTPASSPSPGAAYMEGGRSAHASQPPRQAPGQPRTADLLEAAQDARNQGRLADAKRLHQEAIKVRLAAGAAQVRTAGG